MSENEEKTKPIGKTSSPFKDPNTTMAFNFWLQQGIRINPFDFVVVELADRSHTIGIVEEISAYTDSESHLTNYIGNELGNPDAEPYIDRLAAVVGQGQVLRNIRTDDQSELYMPIPQERRVFFADQEAISKALGYDRIIGTGIPAGVMVQSNGDRIPVIVDSNYLVGPEGAHANASGISGLATKTSYLMFLLHALYNRLENASVIIFNVKHSDLLHIHEPATDLTEEHKDIYGQLDLPIKPFGNVDYFLPRGLEGKPDSDNPPDEFRLYSYTLQDIHSSFDLLFSEVPDQHHTIDAFVNYVRERWESGRVSFKHDKKEYQLSKWSDFKTIPRKAIGETVYHQHWHPTPARINREIQRLTTTCSVFVDQKGANEFYLGRAIRENIKPGKISVIDIYRIPSTTQPFIIGDVMRNLEQLYRSEDSAELPHLIILIDELNTFAPSGERANPIAEQIIEIARKGRARKTALFGAQQFKSEVHRQVWGNSTLHVLGRSGSAELSTRPYGELDRHAKNSIMALKQGEILLSFRNWRYPIKVIFPKPPYKRPD